MASLYTRERSPYWWIKSRDTRPGSLTFGQTVRYSTGLKVGVGPDTKNARQLCADATCAEMKMSPVKSHEHFEAWVASYFRVRCKSAKTLIRYQGVWRNLRMYFEEKNVAAPRQLTRELCQDYPEWRLKPNKRAGKYKAIHNTAVMELKILAMVMSEAVIRNYAPFNPCRDLDIKRHSQKVKPELTDGMLEEIWKFIQADPVGDCRTFLENSFTIARYQGCRLAETHLSPQTDVDLDGNVPLIRFHIKGDRYHTAPLHPKLVPLFAELRKAKATETFVCPTNPSRTWWNFFSRTGLRKKYPGICFHSLRVTAVTRLARSKNVSEGKAMKFIGHASTTVHRVYQRLRVEDLGDCLDALS